MFKNTMAVGPLDPAEDCVTGGAWDANWRAAMGRSAFWSFGASEELRDKLSGSLPSVCRSAIGGQNREVTARK
jgi:hypothetical protein